MNKVRFFCVWLKYILTTKFYEDINSPQGLKWNEKFTTISRTVMCH